MLLLRCLFVPLLGLDLGGNDHRLRGAWLLKQGFVREALEFGGVFLHQLDSCMLLNGSEINIRGRAGGSRFCSLSVGCGRRVRGGDPPIAAGS